MTAAEFAVAERLAASLRLFSCTCRVEYPYNVMQGQQLHHCHRCKALEAWDALRCQALREQLEAGRVP
jgi:hypothetical protein